MPIAQLAPNNCFFAPDLLHVTHYNVLCTPSYATAYNNDALTDRSLRSSGALTEPHLSTKTSMNTHEKPQT